MRVLLIAYRFPPQTGGGTPRPTKMAKYLAAQGVDVTVLTVEAAPYLPLDPAPLAALPANVKVIPLPEQGWMARLRSVGIGRRRAAPWDRPVMLLRMGLHHWLAPDNFAGFIPAVLRAANRPEVRGSDVVISTGGPWSSFVAGDQLARKLGVPHVLDYRDPWTTGPEGWPYPAGWRARQTDRARERRLADRAALVFSAHEVLPELLETKLALPGLRSRCHWIPNGYDEADFAGFGSSSTERFTLTYAGSLYAGRSLSGVIRALDDLAGAGRIDPMRVSLQVLGVSPERMKPEVQGTRIEGSLAARGHLPHRAVLEAITASTINVLVDISYGERNLHTPGKLYEYLRARRPILAVSPAGVTADLVRRAEGGWVVDPDDAEGLRSTLARAYDDWKAGQALPEPRADVYEFFERSRSTDRVRELLEQLMRSKAKGKAA